MSGAKPELLSTPIAVGADLSVTFGERVIGAFKFPPWSHVAGRLSCASQPAWGMKRPLAAAPLACVRLCLRPFMQLSREKYPKSQYHSNTTLCYSGSLSFFRLRFKPKRHLTAEWRRSTANHRDNAPKRLHANVLSVNSYNNYRHKSLFLGCQTLSIEPIGRILTSRNEKDL